MARISNAEIKLNVKREGLRLLLKNNKAFNDLMLDIFTSAKLDEITFSQGQPDRSAFAEGRRSLGLEVLDMLKAAEPRARIMLESYRADANELDQLEASSPPQDDDDVDP